MLGQDIVILGSLKAARELLEKRSANYSDRPQSIMVQLCVPARFSVFPMLSPDCCVGLNTTGSRP